MLTSSHCHPAWGSGEKPHSGLGGLERLPEEVVERWLEGGEGLPGVEKAEGIANGKAKGRKERCMGLQKETTGHREGQRSRDE